MKLILNTRMREAVVCMFERVRRLGVAMAVTALVACGGGGDIAQDNEAEKADYEALLAMFPENNPGTGPDVFSSGPTEQPETLAYVLKAEALMGRSSIRSRQCIERLLALRDQDGDGVAGWGIDQAWDAFGDGSVNPRHQVYLVSNAIVLDGLLMALQANIVEDDQLAAVRDAVSQSLVASMTWFTEHPQGGYFWYSTAIEDALFVPNVSAYLAGVAQKAIQRHPTWFSAEQRSLIQDRIDRAVRLLLNQARLAPDGLPYWAYFDQNIASPNDLVHHGYTVLGLWTYHLHGGAVVLPYDADVFAKSLLVFMRHGKPTEYPQNRPELDPALLAKPARVWVTGYTLDVLTLLGYEEAAEPFVASLKADYGIYPDVRYTPTATMPMPADVFYPRIAAHCLPGLARRASKTFMQ